MLNKTFTEVFSLKNLYNAHLKSRSSKRRKHSIVIFELNTLQNTYEIFQKIQKNGYAISTYNNFIVYEPKRRQIQTLCYKDRIIQRVICDEYLSPYFSKRTILDNAVCQKGKGIHFALRRMEKHLRDFTKKNKQKGYILKCDIKKYFPSIPHKNLYELFSSHIKDEKMKKFIFDIIDSYHTNIKFLEKYGFDILETNEKTGRGLPIGNQTSQIFGMFYLDKLDRTIKEKMRVKIYSRYMDDFVLVHEDKNFLTQCLEEIKKVVKELGLTLNSKTQIIPLKNGFTYLGFRYKVLENGKIVKKVKKATVNRAKKRIKLLNRAYYDGAIDKERIRQTLNAYHGHLSHGNCYKIEQKLISGLKVDIKKEKKNGTRIK